MKQALSILGLPQSLEELLSNSKAFSVASGGLEHLPVTATDSGLVSAAPSSTQVQVLLKSNLGNVSALSLHSSAPPRW